MSKIGEIRALVRNGLYYLTEHADYEAFAEGFDVYDVEHGFLMGKIRRSWPRESKYEVVWPGVRRATDRHCMPHNTNHKGPHHNRL